MIDLKHATVSDLQNDLDARSTTSEALTKLSCASATELHEVFITVDSSKAIRAASESDCVRQAQGPRSKLEGIPVAVKDVVDTAGLLTTMASRHFDQNIPTADAAVVSALRDAGTIIIGKTNAQEFSYGIRGDVGAFGAVSNPHDASRLAGGSSSGSAVAVATGVVPLAVGTDTAGSVRVPAALCGVVGFKPSRGLVDDRGVFPLSPTFDTVGYFGNCVQDIRLALEETNVLPCSTDLTITSGNFSVAGLGDLRRTVVEEVVGRPYDMAKSVMRAEETLLPRTAGQIFDTQGIYDAIRSHEAYVVHQELLESSPHLYQPQTLERLLAGKLVTPAELEEAYSTMAAAQDHFMIAFADADIILSPTVPILAPLVSDKNPLIGQQLMSYCVTWNVLGWPALTVPCSIEGFALPQSIQIIGKPGNDAQVLQAGCLIEDVFASQNHA